MNDIRILITGVAGLIGSRLAKWIYESNFNTRIYGVDNLSNGYRYNVPPFIDKFYKCDVESDKFCRVFEKVRPHIVYHFAAYAAECLSPFIRKYNYTNNLVATANVVNCCINHKVNRLVFTSSMAVYGNGDAPFAETDKLEPIDPYGVAKMACERDIQIAGEQHGLEYCIVRPHNVFGEGQNIWDKYRNVIGIWMRQALYGEPITVYGDGEQQRAFSYIENCLQPLWNAGVSDASRNQIVNLGGRVPHTINEMCGMVMNATGAKIKTNKQCRHEVKKAFSTHEKSVMCLGYKEDISLEDGISSMWKWVNQLPVQRVRMFREYEIDRGVYEYWLPRKGRAPSGLNELKGTCYTGGNIK